VVKVQILDVLRGDKTTDLEHLRRRHPRLLEVVVGQDDVLILRVLIALDDIAPRDLDVLLLAEPFLNDPAAVLFMQEVERELFAGLDRGDQPDRDGHEAEADGALPEWASHGVLCRKGGARDYRRGLRRALRAHHWVKLHKSYRPRRLVVFAVLAGVNKGLGGGGYDPVITLGALFAGIIEKSATAIAALAEGCVSVVGLLAFFAIGAAGIDVDLTLLPSLWLGAFRQRCSRPMPSACSRTGSGGTSSPSTLSASRSCRSSNREIRPLVGWRPQCVGVPRRRRRDDEPARYLSSAAGALSAFCLLA
jgi:hypothetical protein